MTVSFIAFVKTGLRPRSFKCVHIYVDKIVVVDTISQITNLA